MIKIRKTKLALLFLIVIITGCAEGNFDLAENSRLPKWFKIPEGMTRGDVTITMDTYLFPTEKTIFKLWDKKGNKLSVVKGKRFGGYLYPKELKNPPPGYPEGYPSFEVIIANGIIDIIEHRKMEPVFYISDNPEVWRELGVKQ
jgi:hypothetical protein